MKKVKLLVIIGIADDNLLHIVPKGKTPGYPGNAAIHPLWQSDRISIMEAKLGGRSTMSELRFPSPPDVVFSAICSQEASTRALDLAEFVCDKAAADGIKVLNHPGHLRRTTRLDSTKSFMGFDRIVVPEVRMISSPTLASLREMFERSEIGYPTIIRTTTDHNGENMLRVRDPGDLEDLAKLPFGARDYYAIPFIEYADANGIYRKFRLVKVGSKVLPRHMISKDGWNIHSPDRSNAMNQTPEARKEEKRFLSDPKAYLGGDLYAQLIAGLQNTGLDYVAVDFSVLKDRRAVFFESNACFNAFVSKPDRSLPELAKAENKIRSALVQLVVKAARQGKAN